MPFVKIIAAAGVAAIVLGTGPAAFAGAALTTATTRLYDGPVAGAEIVATVAPGARIGVLWCGMHGKWCLVTYHARQGFASSAALKLIGGQALVGTTAVTGAGGNGTDGSGPVSGTTPPHVVMGAGSLTLGPSSPGGSKPVANISATARPH
jgi:uncharacterized protein YraI